MAETNIKLALIALLDGIKTSNGPVVAVEMARLDEILQEERKKIAPQLAHFLERRSYTKALLYLNGENGGGERLKG